MTLMFARRPAATILRRRIRIRVDGALSSATVCCERSAATRSGRNAFLCRDLCRPDTGVALALQGRGATASGVFDRRAGGAVNGNDPAAGGRADTASAIGETQVRVLTR